MTSILEGAVQRGTGKIKELNLQIAAKQEQLITILILGLLVIHQI